MEFFKFVSVKTSEAELRSLLSLENLSIYSSELLPLTEIEDDRVRIGGVWGEFTLTSHPIAGGLRFALQECPNALTWTVTTGFPPEPEVIVIHLTINRKEKEQDFLEEIEEFMEDLAAGIMKVFTPVEHT